MLKFISLLGFSLYLMASAQAQVPQTRRVTLGQGINIDRWLHFTSSNAQDPLNDTANPTPLTFSEFSSAQLDKLPKATDFDYIKGLGLKHIRLPVSINRLTNPNNIGPLNDGTNGTKNHLADLRSVINQITAKGLGVIVCPFNVDDANIGNGLKADLWANPSYQTFWRNLAKALSQNPNNPSMVFLETCNEPNPKDSNGNDTPSLWYNVLPSIVTAMRNGESDAGITTRHTIIAEQM